MAAPKLTDIRFQLFPSQIQRSWNDPGLVYEGAGSKRTKNYLRKQEITYVALTMSLAIWLKPPQTGKCFVTGNSKHTTLDCSNGGRPSTHLLYIAVFRCLQDTTLLLAWVFELDQLQFKTWQWLKLQIACLQLQPWPPVIAVSIFSSSNRTSKPRMSWAKWQLSVRFYVWLLGLPFRLGLSENGAHTLPIGFILMCFFFLGGGSVYIYIYILHIYIYVYIYIYAGTHTHTYIYIYNSPSSDKLRLIVGDFWR